MKTFLEMLSEVGITTEEDILTATTYAAAVSDAIMDHYGRIQNGTLAPAVLTGCLEYFIDVYERQFAALIKTGNVLPPDDDDTSFSIILMSNNVALPTEQAVARRFMRDLTSAIIDTSREIIGEDRKAIAIVLATARKMREGMK